jgi:methylase of polypeptide subunit release factors
MPKTENQTAKKSKLWEKPTRVPSVQLERKVHAIREYVAHLSQRPDLSEYARGVAFVQVLKDLLIDADPQFLQDYLGGMEHSLSGPKTALYNRGRVDALYGNLIIEFKRNISKSLSEAEEQIRKYLALLYSKAEERARPFIGIATDGIQFVAYAPRLVPDSAQPSPEDIRLVEIERANFQSLSPEEAFYWLDRYFVRKTGLLPPRTEGIVKDFGPTSGSFVHAMNVLDAVWKHIADDSESQVFYENWQKYLRITYGGPVAEQELFLRHTYLATLAKIMVWIRLTGATEPPKEPELRSILDGHYFSQRGIQNFLEEDFFAWVARDAAWPQSQTLGRRLLLQLATYNLRELSEDVMKGLYEKLVDPKDRHDLGEYYTPDWLAAMIVRECLRRNPQASVLDPACGSGTFLYQTILYKREHLGNSAKTLRHIEENVVGIDIHPLAVIVAKTIYLLGLGDLLEKRGKAIRIPVYLADSVRPPQEKLKKKRAEGQGDIEFPSPLYWVPLDGDAAEFPEDLALTGELYDRAIELCAQYAASTAKHAMPSEQELTNYLRQNEAALLQNAVWRGSLYELFRVLRNKIRERKDTIWAFILKSVFKPLLMKERFDVVVGNPPWLSYRYVEKGSYQEFLKEEITQHYRLLVGRPELLTHMELGTLFFVRSADFYLRDGGKIGFVLPKSILVADQHHALRQGNHAARLRLTEAWDLEGVRPLFNVPAAVAFGEKSPEKTEWPVKGCVVAGELAGKNIPLEEAAGKLSERRTKYWLSVKGTRSYFSEKEEKPVTEGSPYADKFAEGATIVPRSFWFVEVQKSSGLGIDPARPYVKTDPRAVEAAKEAYKDVDLEGNIEAEFLYRTLLSTDVVPFGHLPFRTVVLPIRWKGDRYEIMTAKHARQEGYLGLAAWLEKCEAIWAEKRGEKASRETIYNWLDYRKKLTQQTRGGFTVIYPKSATYLCAAIVQSGPHAAAGAGDGLAPTVVDHVLYWTQVGGEGEAHYLSAVLNSSVVDRELKPLQSKGDFGPRDIHKKMWAFPIPAYDGERSDHKQLASLGIECRSLVEGVMAGLPINVREGSLGRLRSLLRDKLQPQIDAIDKLVSKFF